MSRQINVLDYLPPVVAETDEFKAIAQAENPELNNLWTEHDAVLDDQFIATMDETSCARWENMLNIKSANNDTLADRRFRILAYINADIPYTYKQLEIMLENLCGADGYTMQLQNTLYKLVVRVALSASKQYSEVEKLLKRTVPANMLIDLALLYNQHQTLAAFTHQQLSAFTHQQLREDDLTNV